MESNINLELIEKVKSGKFAIEHTKKEKDLEKLTVVLNYLFPNDTAQILGMGKYYYTFNNSLSAWWQSQAIPDGMEAIPLSEFFTNELPKEDKQLIGKIDELLGQLNNISQSVFELREHASLVLPDVAPIDTKEEVEYKIMLSDCGLGTTMGRIYECYYEKGEDAFTIIDDLGNRSRGWDFSHFSHRKITRKAYLSQQGEQPNQIKEEVKDRYGINVCANHSRFDVRVYGIETENQANELKDKIKALLATI